MNSQESLARARAVSVLDVPCRYCHAGSGQRCRNGYGEPRRGGSHQARIREARELIQAYRRLVEWETAVEAPQAAAVARQARVKRAQLTLTAPSGQPAGGSRAPRRPAKPRSAPLEGATP